MPGNGPRGGVTRWARFLEGAGREGLPCSLSGRELRRFPSRWSRHAGKRDARCWKARRYRKLEWKRAGFKTPRAWAENERLAKALRESGKPALVVMGVDMARAKSDATYFTRMIMQSQMPNLQNLTPEGMTINEHRAQLGLPTLPGGDVTNAEYAQGIRR